MRHPREDLPVATCDTCGKRCYLTRKAAARAGRRNHPGQHLSAYECGPGDGTAPTYWHLGHLPHAVVTGEITRDDLTPSKARR